MLIRVHPWFQTHSPSVASRFAAQMELRPPPKKPSVFSVSFRGSQHNRNNAIIKSQPAANASPLTKLPARESFTQIHPWLSVFIRGSKPTAHQSHPGLRLGWNLALPRKSLPCFPCLSVVPNTIATTKSSSHNRPLTRRRSQQHPPEDHPTKSICVYRCSSVVPNTIPPAQRLGWNLALPLNHALIPNP